MISDWLSGHIVEVFGAVTGILYVFLEIRQNIFLWPLGIVTSAVYIIVFRENRFYAGMALQVYYLVISIYGWWAWRHQGAKKTGAQESDDNNDRSLKVKRIDLKTTLIVTAGSVSLCFLLWYVLDRWTDSPVPFWDGIITALSVVATWMLTRKILEQWYVWIVANALAVGVYMVMGMYPTAVLFALYFVMAVAGLYEWRRAEKANHHVARGNVNSTDTLI